MLRTHTFRLIISVILLSLCTTGYAQTAARTTKTPAGWTVRPEWVRAHEEFLASDALQGRGSGTRDEWIAATYIGSELREFGVEPAAEDGSYVQKIELEQKVVTAPPVLQFKAGNQETTLTFGQDFRIFRLANDSFSGPLQKIDLEKIKDQPPAISKGAVIFITTPPSENPAVRRVIFQEAIKFLQAGAIALLLPGSPAPDAQQPAALPELAPRIKGLNTSGAIEMNLFTVTENSAGKLLALPDGSTITFSATVKAGEPKFTWNAVGVLHGIDPALKSQVILLSAHLDHLGVGRPVNGDNIYNGADDDASGVTAVLELARALAAGAKPRRTVLFVLFGSEETGHGYGAVYFREKPPVPLANIVANLEFEMIGRPDPKVRPDELWLSGWERSNLGPELAAHGAKLVPDPHPEEQFFARSDNYALALKGVVAQTVSSFGLHPDYHQPSDDVAHLDFQHMTAAIQSMVKPARWLVNSDFKPAWNAGGKP